MKKWILSLAIISVGLFACNGGNASEEAQQTVNNNSNGNQTNTTNTSDRGTDDKTDLDPKIINNPNTLEDNKSGKYPVMTFDKTKHNFGRIKQGEVVEYEFRFRNTGDADLIITNASATCGCTVPKWPKHPIKPGEGGVIPVKFNSAGKQDMESKTVTITANTNPSVNTLVIEVFVEKPSGNL